LSAVGCRLSVGDRADAFQQQQMESCSELRRADEA